MTFLADDPNGWQVHIERDPFGFRDRMAVYRRGGDGVITFASPDGTLADTDSAATMGDDKWWYLPTGAARAISNFVDPGPTTATLQATQTALDLERTRVDRVLEKLLEVTA